MSEKKYPVFVNQGNGQKLQIGVAGEIGEGGGRPIEIWEQFKNTPIANVEIGEAQEEIEVAPENNEKPSGVVNADIPSGLPAEPAEGALAEPKQPVPGQNLRKDNSSK